MKDFLVGFNIFIEIVKVNDLYNQFKNKDYYD